MRANRPARFVLPRGSDGRVDPDVLQGVLNHVKEEERGPRSSSSSPNRLTGLTRRLAWAKRRAVCVVGLSFKRIKGLFAPRRRKRNAGRGKKVCASLLLLHPPLSGQLVYRLGVKQFGREIAENARHVKPELGA
ncbi:hypothetical protein GUJ93_ZPchr0010g9811 [Zizania palustris]|uniref:Uncharacterized protein n=1 Tax=Zizania palustris TaxID=103762 RepID=A0A8J5WD11_ZIZPA|nr:hypothetical protein GUJ93_ZPchr0010g9811 [Zizania palustris]